MLLRLEYEIIKNVCSEALRLIRKNLIRKAHESGLGSSWLNFLKNLIRNPPESFFGGS